MAANEYYDASSRQQTPKPYNTQYQPYNPDHTAGPAPSYYSNVPSRTGSAGPGHDITSPISPFEAPFDDHVYPLREQGRAYDSQSTLGQDSRYYGHQNQSNAALDGQSQYADDIPLRDHPGLPAKGNNVSTDHVYDAPVQPMNLEEGRKRRSGGFGKFINPKSRVPWVTYILTFVQSVIFIVEIIKNGMFGITSFA